MILNESTLYTFINVIKGLTEMTTLLHCETQHQKYSVKKSVEPMYLYWRRNKNRFSHRPHSRRLSQTELSDSVSCGKMLRMELRV